MRRGACAVIGLTIAAAMAPGFVDARAAAATVRFSSRLYGYSIAFPGRSSRWKARLALAPWSSRAMGGIGSPDTDTFTDRRTGRSFLLAARPYASSLRRWERFVVASRPSLCTPPRAFRTSRIGGAPATVTRWSCSDGYAVDVVMAVHARRGYFMLAAAPKALSRTADRRAFDAARLSFRYAAPR